MKARVRIARLVLIAAALVSVIAYAAYTRDIRSARERVATGSLVAETACGPLEYAEAGAGPPVLMVHGAGGGFDQGLEFAGVLAGRGFRVISVSRFGYLGTPLPTDASAAAQADAHACLLDALGIARAAVIGGSAGSPSSVQLALRHPDRVSALVLLVPALYVPRSDDTASVRTPPGVELVFGTALRFDFLFWAALKLAPRAMIGTILATDPQLLDNADAHERARVQRLLETILPVSPRRLGLLNDGAVLTQIERYPLEQIVAPTLVISAADDRYGTFDVARYTAGEIPDARFIGYPGGGHVWVGHHEALMAEIEAFLSERIAIANLVAIDRDPGGFLGDSPRY
jgi:2-hydroxy-6-oxonona-2,4-dienedioate hydrolase